MREDDKSEKGNDFYNRIIETENDEDTLPIIKEIVSDISDMDSEDI